MDIYQRWIHGGVASWDGKQVVGEMRLRDGIIASVYKQNRSFKFNGYPKYVFMEEIQKLYRLKQNI